MLLDSLGVIGANDARADDSETKRSHADPPLSKHKICVFVMSLKSITTGVTHTD
jgi:hypothetical protein